MVTKNTTGNNTLSNGMLPSNGRYRRSKGRNAARVAPLHVSRSAHRHAGRDAGEGICLYPIVNHPAWDDDRHCRNGMFDYADASGRRDVYEDVGRNVSGETVHTNSFER